MHILLYFHLLIWIFFHSWSCLIIFLLISVLLFFIIIIIIVLSLLIIFFYFFSLSSLFQSSCKFYFSFDFQLFQIIFLIVSCFLFLLFIISLGGSSFLLSILIHFSLFSKPRWCCGLFLYHYLGFSFLFFRLSTSSLSRWDIDTKLQEVKIFHLHFCRSPVYASFPSLTLIAFVCYHTFIPLYKKARTY